MALPTPEELQSLLTELTNVVQNYSTAPDLAGYMSRVEVIAKAKKITQAVVAPEQLPNYHGLNLAEAMSIRTFMKLKVLDAIPETGSISLEELSKKTGAQDSLLERLGRVLVATGFLDQTRPDGGEYKHTKFSLTYLSSKPGPGQLFLAMYDEWFKNMYNFDDYLSARNQLSAAQEPSNPTLNPYTWTHKQDNTPIWEIMAQDPEKLQTFQQGMAGIDVAIPVVGHFDFNLLASGAAEGKEGQEVVELVDVGGGHGKTLTQILTAYPSLTPSRTILQDLPPVISLASQSPTLPKGVQLLPHDFTTPQPIKSAHAYFLRMILHDYSDPQAIHILTQLAGAMGEHSRVLVCEMVIPERVDEATFPAAVLDLCVMAMGGKERTEEGFGRLFAESGLEFVRTWRVPGVPGACVEGRLKQ